MAKKTIVNEAVGVVRTVAEAALDAAAAEARRVIAETVANTAARVEDRANKALPQFEGAVRARLVKPIDRMLKTRGGRKKTAKKAAPARGRKAAKKAVRSAAKKAARPSAKKASRKKAATRTKGRKKRR
ncbi:MAG TPA: hypothetical protein VGV41_02845 [Pseudolabrys sp.]|uniref:hypothetical protein n=1 Tax=Pseudolabrys sp. TaxID=1960880 RepID=UPI002DDD3CB5|nr:hypothetical protein [Pseudolabrys sp.]HEV2627565.1 hypothetical protein [Pseudolabrys sp.]